MSKQDNLYNKWNKIFHSVSHSKYSVYSRFNFISLLTMITRNWTNVPSIVRKIIIHTDKKKLSMLHLNNLNNTSVAPNLHARTWASPDDLCYWLFPASASSSCCHITHVMSQEEEPDTSRHILVWHPLVPYSLDFLVSRISCGARACVYSPVPWEH